MHRCAYAYTRNELEICRERDVYILLLDAREMSIYMYMYVYLCLRIIKARDIQRDISLAQQAKAKSEGLVPPSDAHFSAQQAKAKSGAARKRGACDKSPCDTLVA